MRYGLVDTKCPYCKSLGKTEISCGEYMEGCNLKLDFRKASDADYYITHLCNSYGYMKCDMAKMLARLEE